MGFTRQQRSVAAAQSFEVIRNPLCGTPAIGIVIWQRRDAGNPKELFELIQDSLFALANKGVDCHRRNMTKGSPRGEGSI